MQKKRLLSSDETCALAEEKKMKNNNDDNDQNEKVGDKSSSSSSINTPATTTVTSAIINQGGMPTSMQSAPARCEFRGGIEAYCAAASSVLKEQDDGGRFIVCENWLNEHRVHKGAHDAQMDILSVYPVKGKVGRKENLFAVYVMAKKKKRKEEGMEEKEGGCNGQGDDALRRDGLYRPAISVREDNGKWTEEYADILEFMSIPAHHETSHGVPND